MDLEQTWNTAEVRRQIAMHDASFADFEVQHGVFASYPVEVVMAWLGY